MTASTARFNIDPEWSDVVMRTLPRMYRRGEVNGLDDFLFIYANTFFSVKEQVRRAQRPRRSGIKSVGSSRILTVQTGRTMTRNSSPGPCAAPSMTRWPADRRACCKHVPIWTRRRAAH